jgi:hypothetical protein
MRVDSPLWRVMGDPAQAQEAEALAKVRELLPDDGVVRAWANVTFTDNDGRLNEVDVLVLTRVGLWIVELKGWHGEIKGDQRTWFHGNRIDANPRLLANAKAKRLATVLKDLAQSGRLPKGTVPYVNEAVVLHGRDSRVRLDQYGAESVWSLDGFDVHGLGASKKFSDLLAQPGTRELIDRACGRPAAMPNACLTGHSRPSITTEYSNTRSGLCPRSRSLTSARVRSRFSPLMMNSTRLFPTYSLDGETIAPLGTGLSVEALRREVAGAGPRPTARMAPGVPQE